MFTGLIEAVGTIKKIRERGNYRVLSISSKLSSGQYDIGESVACDGVCLTVVAASGDTFVVEASQETARKTIIDDYHSGAQINIERAMKADGRWGGHFVTGHVDEVGVVDYCRPIGESLELAIKFDSTNDHLVIEKGSITIDGVSLTINKIRSGWLCVNLIPHTAQATTLRSCRTGDRVNLEFDMIGKYVQRANTTINNKTLTKDKLMESGW